MSNITPEKTNIKQVNSLGFSPVILPQSPSSSQKNLTGSPRIAKDIVADLYNNIQHWNDCHIKGAQTVKNIAVLKSDTPKLYSSELEVHTDDLYKIVQNLAIFKANFESFKSQIRALGKLKQSSAPLFISLDPVLIADLVETIANAYIKEFQTKTVILENIAHSKNKHEVMFFAACWTLQPHITAFINMKLEALLMETGHRIFS